MFLFNPYPPPRHFLPQIAVAAYNVYSDALYYLVVNNNNIWPMREDNPETNCTVGNKPLRVVNLLYPSIIHPNIYLSMYDECIISINPWGAISTPCPSPIDKVINRETNHTTFVFAIQNADDGANLVWSNKHLCLHHPGIILHIKSLITSLSMFQPICYLFFTCLPASSHFLLGEAAKK